MKFLAILLSYAAVCYAQLDLTPIYCTGERMKAIHAQCMVEENATEMDISDLLAQRAAQTENSKCFRACSLRECKFMDSYGNVGPKAPQGLADMLGSGDPDKMNLIESIVKMCMQIVPFNGSRCQNAEEFVKCVLITCNDNKCDLDLENL